MFPIVAANALGPGVRQFEIEAPRIARKQRAGQFVIVREDEVRTSSDELFVMTDDGSDGEKGLVTDKLRALIETRNIRLRRKAFSPDVTS